MLTLSLEGMRVLSTVSEKPSSHHRETLASLGLFVVQRLLFGALILLAIAYLVYFGLDMAEGADLQVALLRAGRNTATYVRRALQGDWGLSVAASATYEAVPVAEAVPELVVKSLGLLAVSLAVATLIGITLGLWAARRRHTGWSLVTLLLSVAGISVPSFFAALLLQLGAIRWTRTFGRALLPVGGFGWDERIILPALVLAARPIAQIARLTYVTVGQVLDEDFVRTAHSKGLSGRLVMSRHVLRNAAIPILTTIGVSLRFSLSSLPVVELFFNWTGLGFAVLKAIARRDDNLTVALMLFLGLLFIAINLVLEMVYRLIDPRLRESGGRVAGQEREGLISIVRALAVDAWESIAHLPLWSRLRKDKAEPSASPFGEVSARRGITVDVEAEEYKEERRRAWVRGTVSNVPFVIGALLVAALLAVVLFGPAWTPHSPYTKLGLEYSDGELSVPPFAPDEIYPWGTDPLGRDIMSLVLSGAQQTLLLAASVVIARVVLGFVLGALAGWLSGGWIDRLLLGLAEVLAAFPTLLLAMTLILGLGVQRGLIPFVLALSFVGWGEIMQLVRSEVMAIRVRPFVESALATGLRTPRLIWSHVLPNLLSTLISVAALEMGAVLMILGELGFVGIFIGGGAFAELQIDAPPYHYSDVPEWGAMLSNIRLYARTYPWTAVYPTLAFFVSILGFNLLGEGIRRMVETVGVRFSRVLNRYTLALALVAALGISWVQAYTGTTAYYRQHAAAFDGDRALALTEALCDPALEGRALGTKGHSLTADLIAERFGDVGLQPGGQELGFFQERKRSYYVLDAEPVLESEALANPKYHTNYAEFPGQTRNLGDGQGNLRILATGGLTLVRTSYAGSSYKAFRDVDLTGDIILMLSPRDAFTLERLGLHGMLVVAPDEQTLARRYTLSPRDPRWQVYGTGRDQGRFTPMLWIDEQSAGALLAQAGYSLADLQRQAEPLQQDEVIDLETEVPVRLQTQGTVVEKVPVRHVIGHLPGLSDSRYGGINQQTIVVLAQYDSPPLSPDGTLYPGANDNASGLAVMLEAIRTMQETGYQPYRTFLFIAYSGEGLEGGEPVDPSDVSKFLAAHYGFSSGLEVEAIVHLRGLGAGAGDRLLYSAMGSRRLSKVFQTSARRMGVATQSAEADLDISIVFEEKSRWEGGQEAPEIVLTWEGWEERARLPSDDMSRLSVDKLEASGRALTLALMTLGRELDY